MAHARHRLASYKRPKGVEIWSELPKSSANKILRRAVRDRVIARQKAETKPARARETRT
jgi:acyl-coenzyme A synthetase/AMP-(fatty) acid ligase